jgi:hypothetical protein
VGPRAALFGSRKLKEELWVDLGQSLCDITAVHRGQLGKVRVFGGVLPPCDFMAQRHLCFMLVSCMAVLLQCGLRQWLQVVARRMPRTRSALAPCARTHPQRAAAA